MSVDPHPSNCLDSRLKIGLQDAAGMTYKLQHWHLVTVIEDGNIMTLGQQLFGKIQANERVTPALGVHLQQSTQELA
jgi:hypothetical protein